MKLLCFQGKVSLANDTDFIQYEVNTDEMSLKRKFYFGAIPLKDGCFQNQEIR
jgi:hypothetical protein